MWEMVAIQLSPRPARSHAPPGTGSVALPKTAADEFFDRDTRQQHAGINPRLWISGDQTLPTDRHTIHQTIKTKYADENFGRDRLFREVGYNECPTRVFFEYISVSAKLSSASGLSPL